MRVRKNDGVERPRSNIARKYKAHSPGGSGRMALISLSLCVPLALGLGAHTAHLI